MKTIRIAPRAAFLHLLAIALAAITAMAIFAPFVSGVAKSKGFIACGGDRNQVEDDFIIARPSDIWKVFPAMLKSPELEADPNPAEVVVFAGDVDLSGMVAAGAEPVPTVSDVVCIVHADGTVDLYDNVSRAGYNPP
jgi:hypothetical protein